MELSIGGKNKSSFVTVMKRKVKVRVSFYNQWNFSNKKARRFLLSLPSVVNQSTVTRHEALSLRWLSRKETFEQRLAEEGWRNTSRLDKGKWRWGNFGGWWDEWCVPAPNAASCFNELEILCVIICERRWSHHRAANQKKARKNTEWEAEHHI